MQTCLVMICHRFFLMMSGRCHPGKGETICEGHLQLPGYFLLGFVHFWLFHQTVLRHRFSDVVRIFRTVCNYTLISAVLVLAIVLNHAFSDEPFVIYPIVHVYLLF